MDNMIQGVSSDAKLECDTEQLHADAKVECDTEQLQTDAKLDCDTEQLCADAKLKCDTEQLHVDAERQENSEADRSENVKSEDPFAYLERRDFTSEKFKVEIRGLPRFYGFGELKRMISETMGLSCTKVKPPRRGCSWAYACFRTEEERTKALELINGYVWKKATLSARPAQAAPDPFVSKRLRRSDFNEKNNRKKAKLESESGEALSLEDRLRNSVSPLWNLPYSEQQLRKREDLRQLLLKFGSDLLNVNKDLSPWMREQREKYDGLPCPLMDIRSAPVINGYRNKCEFSIGLNPETHKVTVGFRLGSYADGSLGVAPLNCVPHVPDCMKDVAKAMEGFIDLSGYSPFNHETHEGFWRQIIVRLGFATGELMLVAGMHPQNLTEDELNDMKVSLVKFFSEGPGASCNIKSLYFQSLARREQGSKHPSCEHLWGQTHIHDVLLGMKFRISPEAFFQVNSSACEELYKAIGEVANLSKDTTLLDVCCGTGTIGLCLSKQCGQVLGIELIEEAVKDAEYNADLNDVKNCSFFDGRAEDILATVIAKATFKELVAVVDPPRAGLHQKAIVTLRRAREIEKLVYVSCDPRAALKNFIDLGRPPSKSLRGFAMVPVKAIPVDLFPHTKLCELIVYFERIDTRAPEERLYPGVESCPVGAQQLEQAASDK